MKFAFVSLSLVLFLSAPAFAMTADELAAKLQSSYDKTRDMRADFTQVSTVKAMGIEKTGSGTLVIKKPGRLRYSYKKPEKQELIVRDGMLTMYAPASKQVVTKRLERALMDKTPSTFLAGMGKVTDSFTVHFQAGGEKDAQGRYRLLLVPKGEKMGGQFFPLLFDPQA